MVEERPYWNMEIEPILNTPQMRELQWNKMPRVLEWQYENSPFNRARFDKAGVKPGDIKSLEQLNADVAQANRAV